MTEQTAMTVDDLIREFGAANRTLPRAAMQWALDHWMEASPRLVAVLSQCADADEAERTEATANAVFLIAHLCGERAEAAAFVPLCRLLHDAEAAEFVFGDAITETLRHILIRTFNGDVAPLQGLVEDARADEFIRDGALLSMAYLTALGRIPREDMHAYLRHLVTGLRPQAESPVWSAWVNSVAGLGITDLVPDVRNLFARGFIDPMSMGYDNFEADLKSTLDDPAGLAGFALHQLEPFVSAIDALDMWYAVWEQGARDEEEYDEEEYAERQAALARLQWPSGGDRNPLRHVGRNDPCPCGSGKKFKKCCLGKAELMAPAEVA
jgi:uncharacterized protein